MIGSRDALVATVIAVGILGGWYVENRPQTGHAAALRDLYASPVCLRGDGRPRPGSPSVAAAWERTSHLPIGRMRAVFIGEHTIELRTTIKKEYTPRRLAFLSVDAHRWRPNDDSSTLPWVRQICGTGPA